MCRVLRFFDCGYPVNIGDEIPDLSLNEGIYYLNFKDRDSTPITCITYYFSDVSLEDLSIFKKSKFLSLAVHSFDNLLVFFYKLGAYPWFDTFIRSEEYTGDTKEFYIMLVNRDTNKVIESRRLKEDRAVLSDIDREKEKIPKGMCSTVCAKELMDIYLRDGSDSLLSRLKKHNIQLIP